MVAATSSNASNNDLAAAVTDELAWDAYSCWKEQLSDRFGGGNSAPPVPHSQRQYDGDNHFEYCEIWAI